jgi:hypothetical protein
MSIHVFLGPSLSSDEGKAILPDAKLLPPAQAGDVYKAVENGATVIGIVDGYFEQVPSIWHKEILYALHRGVHVLGASSMGALRAAELHPFGMVGIGTVFERYRDGICEDDDEVTVAHGPELEGFRPLSEAMVNIRYALGLALEGQIITKATHDALVHAQKRRHYPERSWGLLPELGIALEVPPAELDALIRFVRREKPNLKRLDALRLMAELARMHASPPPRFEPTFDFQPTVFWEQLVASMRSAPSAARLDVPIESIRTHLAVVDEEAVSVFHGSLFLYLVAKEASRLGIQARKPDIARITEQFRRSFGLLSAAATHRWIEASHFDHERFSALMEMLALVDAVLEHHVNAVDAFLPAELQRRGRFGAVASAVLEKKQIVAHRGLTFPSPEDVGTTTEGLLGWYERRFRPLGPSVDSHAKDRGAFSVNSFLRELLAEYLRTAEPQRSVGEARA